jgi:hypothetical protein
MLHVSACSSKTLSVIDYLKSEILQGATVFVLDVRIRCYFKALFTMYCRYARVWGGVITDEMFIVLSVCLRL